MRIITCPFCKFSAAYDPEDEARAAKMNESMEAHLKEHVYDENV